MTSKIYSKYVPSEGPTTAKIMIVGEAPGADEVHQGRPFIGQSGELLTNVLLRNGIQREQVFLTNLCHFRPDNNDFKLLYKSPELGAGLDELRKNIELIKPNVVVATGNYPLYYLTGKGRFNEKDGTVTGIQAYRGSILSSTLSPPTKVISTLHPAYVVRDRSMYPIFDMDIKRCISDSLYPEVNHPQRKFIIHPKGLELEEWTQTLEKSARLATDIESVRNSTHILCVGFSPSPDLAVCIVNDGTNQYRNALLRILSSNAKKCFHFGTFDVEMLRLNGYETRNYDFDTHTAAHSLFPELPRSLAFLTSIYTREPYYKSEGRDEIPGDIKSWSDKSNREVLYRYNCKDACVTREIWDRLQTELEHSKEADKVFRFEMSELFDDEEPGLIFHLMGAGLLQDKARHALLKESLEKRRAELENGLNAVLYNDLNEARTAGTLNLKAKLSKKPKPLHFNVRSVPQMQWLLYDHWKVRSSKSAAKSTDEDTIIDAIAYCKDYIDSLKTPAKQQEWAVKLMGLKAMLELRGIRQLISNYINATASEDGRVRSVWKCAATETGRWAAECYVDGTGLNSQTFSRGGVKLYE